MNARRLLFIFAFEMNLRVYIETTVVSYLTARPSRDLLMAARQEVTCEWWDRRLGDFDCYISQLVIDEASEGDALAAEKRLDAVKSFSLVPVDDSVITLAEKLVSSALIPAIAADDALHIALAAVHGMNYLLTWNFKHIANAGKTEAIREACALAGFTCPVICTPEELLEES